MKIYVYKRMYKSLILQHKLTFHCASRPKQTAVARLKIEHAIWIYMHFYDTSAQQWLAFVTRSWDNSSWTDQRRLTFTVPLRGSWTFIEVFIDTRKEYKLIPLPDWLQGLLEGRLVVVYCAMSTEASAFQHTRTWFHYTYEGHVIVLRLVRLVWPKSEVCGMLMRWMLD